MDQLQERFQGFGVSTLAVEWIEIEDLFPDDNLFPVSTLAVEWIEIKTSAEVQAKAVVSTLAVEWIEIYPPYACLAVLISVSTLAVEWIEIAHTPASKVSPESLHPRGGVD